METPSADKELRFRNVTLHNDGRKENGTLHLHRHHLCFRWHPEAPKKDPQINSPRTPAQIESKRSEVSTESSTASSAATEDGQRSTPVRLANGNVEGAKAEGRDSKSRQQMREIWVPYPIIYSCVLRPSHAPSQVARPRDDSGHPMDGEEDLFPPTFGTASYERPSTDSARLAPYSSPSRPSSPGRQSIDAPTPTESARQPAIRIKGRDFKMLALHFHQSHSGPSADEVARQVFYVLRDRGCVNRIEDMHAFHYHPPKEETSIPRKDYDARREYARMGISGKAADGPGTAWRISEINHDYSYSPTYPKVLCVPTTVSDNMLKYGGPFRSRTRIPCLAYLHSNGGSITRSSQPMVGLQNKRNPQDEKLVSAIFSSHTPPLQPTQSSSHNQSTTSLPSLEAGSTDPADKGASGSHSDHEGDDGSESKDQIPQKKIYGSTRRNLIVDARPKVNAQLNRAGGGGVEDVANYTPNSPQSPVELVYLNIANIHVMRKSLDKVTDAFANSDYIKLKPSEETLRNSGWLGHIANMLDGAEMVARVVGLGGSHVLLHCSDGWDRTAQVSALAQLMLDPHYRTLDGFITLVQKDFLSFGHKFRDRNGIEGSEKGYEIENERILPRDGAAPDPTTLNKYTTKAFSGARSWLEKNRSTFFRPSPTSDPPSRPASPPLVPTKEEKKHKTPDTEISPVVHQFLDTTHQLLHHHPTRFEFNDRFLRRLFWHVYSCQYGDFLFNTERDRSLHPGLPSVWSYFLSRRAEFTNPEYVPPKPGEDTLVFPTRGSDRGVEVRWWSALFGRKDEEMNSSRALAPADPPPAATARVGTGVAFDPDGGERRGSEIPGLEVGVEGVRIRDEGTGPQGQSPAGVRSPEPPQTQTQTRTQKQVSHPDAAPASTPAPKVPERSGLDFAAFASQNAFQDR